MKTEKEINHEKCLQKVRKAVLKENPELTHVWFDLSQIITWDENGNASKYKKTGQAVTIGVKRKKRDGSIVTKNKTSFIAHEFCPFCGKPFNPSV